MATVNKILPCFEHIIGLSRTDCPCDPADKPADADESVSALYLDELEGGISFEAIKNINDCGDLWDKMEASRQQATEDTQRDITVALNTKYKSQIKPFTGEIGQPISTGVNISPKQYVGLKLRAEPFRDAQITIKSGFIWLDTVMSGEIIVMKAYQNADFPPEQITTIPFTSVANAMANIGLNTPIVLPLWDEKMLPIDYYFVYNKPPGVNPKNNKVGCNCGGAESVMKQYVYPNGVYTDDLSALRHANTDSFANGLSLNVDIACKSDIFICQSLSNSEEIMISAAYAVLYKSGAKLIEKVLGSTDVSRYTLMNREYHWGKRNHFIKQYNTHIDFIADNIDIDESDCYTCGDKRMFKGGIKI